MNEATTNIVNTVLPSASINEISMTWLLVIAAFAIMFSLLEAWIATLIIYVKIDALKKIFPVPHNLIRSHIDYLLMSLLLVAIYFVCLHLNISLPKSIIIILLIGALYNPFGFFIQAINPKAGKNDTFAGKLGVCLGFLPTTIGYSYSAFIIMKTLVT